MAEKEKELKLYDNNPNINKIKYSDTDFCSKRQKLHKINEQEENEEKDDENTYTSISISDETYIKFEKNANANCCQSSFINPFSSTSNIEEVSNIDKIVSTQKFESSVKDNLLITDKPSVSSKGFENTFKLLQNQVKMNTQKTIDLLKLINPDNEFPSSSTSSLYDVREVNPTRLELELEAMKRIQVYVKDLQQIRLGEKRKIEQLLTPLLELLYNFVSKEISKDFLNETKQTETLLNDSEFNSNLMYHVGKNTNGAKCLKIMRKLLNHEEGIL